MIRKLCLAIFSSFVLVLLFMNIYGKVFIDFIAMPMSYGYISNEYAGETFYGFEYVFDRASSFPGLRWTINSLYEFFDIFGKFADIDWTPDFWKNFQLSIEGIANAMMLQLRITCAPVVIICTLLWDIVNILGWFVDSLPTIPIIHNWYDSSYTGAVRSLLQTHSF